MISLSMTKFVKTSQRVAMLLCCLSTLLVLTGCVGPMGCGPMAGGCGGCDSCSGCGELYIDPWINEPADQCDPCDCCGNFNGQSCGRCRPMFSGIKSLWGYKCDGGCDSGCDGGCNAEVGCGAEAGCGCGAGGCDGGCDSGCGAGGCSSGGCSSCGGGDFHGAINYSHGGESYVQGRPSMVHDAVVEVSPRGQAYHPSHTRKIFKPKNNIAGSPTPAKNY